MPVKDSVKLGSGSLYFKGMDEPVEIRECEITYDEEEYADDIKYIRMNIDPVTFECQAEFNRNWTLVKCMDCGYEFPVTEFYTLIHGTSGWRCPRCVLNRALREARDA